MFIGCLNRQVTPWNICHVCIKHTVLQVFISVFHFLSPLNMASIFFPLDKLSKIRTVLVRGVQQLFHALATNHSCLLSSTHSRELYALISEFICKSRMKKYWILSAENSRFFCSTNVDTINSLCLHLHVFKKSSLLWNSHLLHSD